MLDTNEKNIIKQMTSNQHNWITSIYDKNINNFRIVMKIRCCYYTKQGNIDGHSKRRRKLFVR